MGFNLFYEKMRKRLEKVLQSAATGMLVVVVIIAMCGLLSVERTSAYAPSSRSDVMTRLEDGVASNHTISFTQYTTTQFAAGETITLQFDPSAQGFNLGSLSASDAKDYDITVGGTEESIVASGGCASNDAIEVTTVNTTTDTITFTACGSYTAGAAGAAIVIEIGTNATAGGSSGDSQITNPGSTGTKIITIAGTFGDDSSDIAVQIIDDDSVNITATVDETLSFAISDVTIEFGTLSDSAAKWADDSGGNGSDTVAHTMTASTNATSGYSITVQGATLNANGGAGTIDNIDPRAGSSTGTEQFGMYITASGGSGSVDNDYDNNPANEYYYGDTALTGPDAVATSSGPSATTTYSHHYIANISSITEAGAYSTDLTYITTATY